MKIRCIAHATKLQSDHFYSNAIGIILAHLPSVERDPPNPIRKRRF